VKVNDTFAGNQYEPHLRVDPSGGLHVCWIWNLPFQTDIDLYYSVSTDGGISWLWPTPRVNDIPYVVQPYVAWTSDMLADERGSAYLFWNDGRDTHYYDNVYCSTNREPAGIAIGEEGRAARELSGPAETRATMQILGQPGPDPVVLLRLEEPVAELRLDLLDLEGRRLVRVHIGPLGAGEHRFALPRDDHGGMLAQGVYLLRMMTADEMVMDRLSLIR